MRRVGVAVLLAVALVLFGTRLPFGAPTSPARTEVRTEVRTVTAPDGSRKTVRVRVPTVADPTVEVEPKVTQLLREARERGRKRASGNDDPNAGAPTSLVASFIPKQRVTLGRVRIPAIDLDVRYASGVYERVLEKGPGHWPGTPLPGNAGNAVLSGHRTTFTHPFGDLDLLEPGDRVVTTVGEQKPVTYRVTDTTVVPEAEYVDFVTTQPDRPRARTITMFACTPKGQRTHRIVVQAHAEPAPRQQGGASG
ncbi:MAG: class E sortase [Euzebyales bacterium]|nr:class E sortase [Euzebyales bacterium]MBA3620762.1 class E sortase [Euzebyales bacterium]